jgi:D-amino-acid dehydrogenase
VSEPSATASSSQSPARPGETIIVGAGIIGIACAHYLAKAGVPVTVIDRGAVASGCSHGNCGYICPSHVLPLTEPGAIRTALRSLFAPQSPFRVRPRLSPALWNWMWQFARRCNERQMLAAGQHLKSILDSSMAEYRQLMAAESLDCEWRESGLLYVLRSERALFEMAETDKFLTEHFGLAARRIEGRDLSALDPALLPGLAGAFHYEGDASVRPDLLNACWARRLRERGVTFLEHCELQRIIKSNGRITALQTSQGDLAAERFVFATGAWSTRLSSQLQCRIPIQPGKGYSVTMSRPDPCPRLPMLFPEHRVGVSPFAQGYRLGSIMEFAGYDASIPPRRIEQLQESAKHYLVAPVGPGERQTWYGWRPMTWDSLPIIGRAPRLANAWLATGHNMLGMTLAPATGRLIAELIEDRSPHIDPAPYSPARF